MTEHNIRGVLYMDNNKPRYSNLLKDLFKKRSNIQKPINQIKSNKAKSTLLDCYISILEKHPDIILVFTLDGKLVSQNKNSINERLGYRSKQKLSFKELVSEEDYTLLQSAFQNASKGTSEIVTFDVFHKQGEQLNIIGTFIPIETSECIEGVVLVLKDITAQKQLEKENMLKATHLEQAQQIANIGSWEYLISKDELRCSKSFFDIFGLEESESTLMEIPLSRIHTEDKDKIDELLEAAITDGVGYTTEFRIYHGKTNELRHIKVQVEVEEKENKPFKLIGVVKDYTEQRMLDMELKETNKSFRHIFDNLNVGIWMRESIDGKITFASQGMTDLLQIPLSKLYEQPDCWQDMILPMYREELFKKYKLLSHGKMIEHKYRIKAEDGKLKWVYEQTIPRVNKYGEVTHLFGMVADISSEIEIQEKLEFLAKNDALTALPNYNGLYEKLDELMQNDDTKTFALFYVGLDNFNWVTDYLGYQITEVALKNIANRLIAILPPKGYLARTDNDSFVFIIPNFKNKDFINQLAEKIIKTIENQIMVEEYELFISSSIGISFYPDNGDNKLILLENARTALYHAKKLGKNNYQIYSFDRDISSHKKYVLERDLRKAIQNEDFEIYYQPQVNPNSGVIEGAEALIRWNHKDWGVVSPAEFIPIAEEKHLIHHIGNWVIRTVCKQLQTWRNEGYTLYPISINISPIRFLKPGIVEVVKKELEHYQIPAKYLEIEITESILLQNEKNVSETLNALKELGIRIALDDFGTGYSSFHYLQKFNLDTLKIDKIFIQNLDSEDTSNIKEAAIVSSFLHLAKGLNMKVVAEGVEEYEQMEFLKQKECDLIQGYLYSKPVPVDKFEQMMKVRYLKPTKQKKYIKPEKERRKYFRFVFPFHLLAKMNITEVNERKVSLGYGTILVENISLGGIRFLSTLRLPVTSNIKLNFKLKLMNECFNIDGSLVYQNEEKPEIFSYGVSFSMTGEEQDELAEVINRMTVLKRLNQSIPKTDFIEEDPYLYLRKKLI